jgi:hypothetical protein
VCVCEVYMDCATTGEREMEIDLQNCVLRSDGRLVTFK